MKEESDLDWHSVAATGYIFDAFNGFPGPLPSQGPCQAKLADSWSARAGLPQLVYFSKQLISKARLDHQEVPATWMIPGDIFGNRRKHTGKYFNRENMGTYTRFTYLL